MVMGPGGGGGGGGVGGGYYFRIRCISYRGIASIYAGMQLRTT